MQKEPSRKSNGKTLLISAVIAALLALPLLAGCSGGKSSSTEPWMKDYAAELEDQGLYEQAASAWEKYLMTPGLPDDVRANVYYRLADLQRERLFDYESAMANYLKVKYIDPDTDLKGKIDKHVVECLEKMGRSSDARRELDKIVSAEPKDSGDEKIAARIGDRAITVKELDRLLERQTPSPDKLTKQDKVAFLRSYIANDLMAEAAVRKGYDKDPDMLKSMEDARRSVLAQKIYREEIASKTSVDPEKVRLYYDANQAEFTDDDGNVKPFEQAQQQIYTKLYIAEQQKVAQDYIQRLLQAERVEINEDNITGAAPPKDPYEGNKLK